MNKHVDSLTPAWKRRQVREIKSRRIKWMSLFWAGVLVGVVLSFLGTGIISSLMEKKPTAVDSYILLWQENAPITRYSEIDSCHTGKSCLMANGVKAYVGAIACPRNIPFGTKFLINHEVYVCSDRTSARLDGRWDIFTGYGVEAYQQAKAFGLQRYDVYLYISK
jgi:hypothetical protein